MKIFISWSGKRSSEVANLFKWWLESVIQHVETWVSTQDIGSGEMWPIAINEQLGNSGFGIVCLTKDNKTKPWILFEAGALAKGLSANRVCTFLIEMEPKDITTPLSHFQSTIPSKESVKKLVKTINDSLEHPLKEKILEGVFETFWPQFDKEYKKIIEGTTDEKAKESRSSDSMLSEVLETVRALERRLIINNKLKNVLSHNAITIKSGDNEKVIDYNRVSLVSKGEKVKTYALELYKDGKVEKRSLMRVTKGTQADIDLDAESLL